MTTEEHHAHLPECWNTVVSDPVVSCICDELRDCEQRVLDAVQVAVYAVTPDLTVSGPIMIRRADILAAIGLILAPTDAEIAVDDEQRIWIEALDAARRVVAGFLDIDTETGDRRCSDPACDLCIAAPLIYAALEDLAKG